MTTAGGLRVVGDLSAAGPDSLVITRAGQPSVPLRAPDHLLVELSGGRSRLAGAGAGAFLGAGIGGVLGGIAGSLSRAACTGRCSRPGPEALGTFGALTSIWAGALVGAAVGREIWIPMMLDLRPSPASSHRGEARLMGSFRF